MHAVDPVVFVENPAGQWSHIDTPKAVVNVPAPQSMHVVAPFEDM